MEWSAPLETGLATIVVVAKFCLEAISVFCVVLGLIKTLQLAIDLKRHHHNPLIFNEIRLLFGSWLALALEFQLGADILATTIAPTLEALTKLALIAIIRTFLNHFLNKELETQSKLQRDSMTDSSSGGRG